MVYSSQSVICQVGTIPNMQLLCMCIVHRTLCSLPQYQRATLSNKLDSLSLKLKPSQFISAMRDVDSSTTLLLPLHPAPLFFYWSIDRNLNLNTIPHTLQLLCTLYLPYFQKETRGTHTLSLLPPAARASVPPPLTKISATRYLRYFNPRRSIY